MPKTQKVTEGLKRPVPWEPVKMRLFSVSDPFPKTLSRDERLRIAREVGQTAKTKFNEKFPAIQRWFADYDALYILSVCSFYFLSHPKGIDPEIEGKMEFAHHHLELLQAFALRHDRTISPRPLLAEGDTLKSEMREIGEIINLRMLATIPPDATQDDVVRHTFISDIRRQTTAVRNWAYHNQTFTVAKALMEKIRPDFESLFGVNPEKLVSVLSQMADRMNDRLNDHMDRLRSCLQKKDYREMIQAYNEAFPETEPISDVQMEKLFDMAARDLGALQGMLLAHADLRLYRIYTFDVEEIAEMYGAPERKPELQVLFDSWSYCFGDLRDHNAEHFILTNPVLGKPFIKLTK